MTLFSDRPPPCVEEPRAVLYHGRRAPAKLADNRETWFIELADGKAALPFGYRSLPLRHSSECFGLRIEAEGLVFSKAGPT